MDISIIICTYNRADKLSTALESIVKQEMSEQIAYEVVVVDNNSSDNTREVLKKFEDRFPQIFHYFFEKRQGKRYALNTGIKKAQGQILAFADDDAVMDNHWIISIKEAFDNLDSNCFGGKILPTCSSKIPDWIVRKGLYRNTGGVLVDHDRGEKTRSYSEEGMYAPCGANMFFKKHIFEKYGGFNDKLTINKKPLALCEDTEFCLRLMDHGEKILYFPKAIVYHPIYQHRLKKNFFRQYYIKSGRLIALIEKIPAASVRYFNVPRFIFRRLLKNLYQYFLSIILFDSKRRFFYELKTFHVLGIIYEYFKQRKQGKI